jgi:hypothetical protein
VLEHLGGTDSIQNFDAEAALPPAENIGRKWFRGGNRQADTVRNAGVALGLLQHHGVQGGHGKEKSGPRPLQSFEDRFGLRFPRKQHRRRAGMEGHHQSVAQSICVKKFGG